MQKNEAEKQSTPSYFLSLLIGSNSDPKREMALKRKNRNSALDDERKALYKRLDAIQMANEAVRRVNEDIKASVAALNNKMQEEKVAKVESTSTLTPPIISELESSLRTLITRISKEESPEHSRSIQEIEQEIIKIDEQTQNIISLTDQLLSQAKACIGEYESTLLKITLQTSSSSCDPCVTRVAPKILDPLARFQKVNLKINEKTDPLFHSENERKQSESKRVQFDSPLSSGIQSKNMGIEQSVSTNSQEKKLPSLKKREFRPRSVSSSPALGRIQSHTLRTSRSSPTLYLGIREESDVEKMYSKVDSPLRGRNRSYSC